MKAAGLLFLFVAKLLIVNVKMLLTCWWPFFRITNAEQSFCPRVVVVLRVNTLEQRLAVGIRVFSKVRLKKTSKRFTHMSIYLQTVINNNTL